MKISLSIRVLIAASLVTCAILVVAGSILLVLLRFALSSELDQRLLHTAQNLTTTVEQVNGRITFEWEGISTGPTSIFRVYRPDGQVIAKSSTGPAIDIKMLSGPVTGSHEFLTSKLSDGSNSRIVRLSFIPFQENDDEYDRLVQTKQIPPSQDIVVMEVAFVTADLESVMHTSTLLWIAITLAASIITPLVLWPIVVAALRPVRSVASQIENLDASNLSNQLNTSNCPRELLPITTRLNDLMNRLEASFEREKQITGNLAHELKTPLAGLSATLELAASKPRTNESYQTTIQKSRLIVSELITLSERILQLARLEAGEIKISPEQIELATFFDEIRHDLELLYSQEQLKFQTNFEELRLVSSDRIWLKQILMNVCQNAVEHGVKGRPIIFTSHSTPHQSISISNTCSGVTPDILDKLKERFFQLDKNRSATGLHAGLGLAICDQIAKSLNASLQLSLIDNDTFVVSIQWQNP